MSPIDVVGIGADGAPGLSAAARSALLAADVVIGSDRQLGSAPGRPGRRAAAAAPPAAPGPGRPDRRSPPGGRRRLVVLASGDPMLARHRHDAGRGWSARTRCGPHPAPSTLSLACARLGWPPSRSRRVSLLTEPADRPSPPRSSPGRRAARPAAPAPADLADGRRPAVPQRFRREHPDPAGRPRRRPTRRCEPARRRRPRAHRTARRRRGRVRGRPGHDLVADRARACRTRRSSTTASSPSARCGRARWPGSRPRPAQLLWDVGAGAGQRRRSSGCGRSRAAAPSPSSGTPSARTGSRRNAAGWACRACSVVAGRAPARWPACPRRTPCSSAAARPRRACSTPAGRRCARWPAGGERGHGRSPRRCWPAGTPRSAAS